MDFVKVPIIEFKIKTRAPQGAAERHPRVSQVVGPGNKVLARYSDTKVRAAVEDLFATAQCFLGSHICCLVTDQNGKRLKDVEFDLMNKSSRAHEIDWDDIATVQFF